MKILFRARRARVALVGAAAVLATTGLVAGAPGDPLTDAAPVLTASKIRSASGDFATLVSAGGQTQWLACRGTGPVTLVISPGWADTASSWMSGPDYATFDKFARMTRTCVMDRAGLGRSRPRKGAAEATAGQQARELHAALLAAGEKGPFIPVGHSYAGLIVRSFVAQFLAEVAGLELMDAATPRDYYGHWGGPEPVNLDASNAQIGGMNRPKLGAKPLLVIGGTTGETRQDEQAWLANQAKAIKLSDNAMHILVQRGQHELQKAPDYHLGQAGFGRHIDGRPALIKATRMLLKMVVGGTSFGPCTGVWARMSSTCAVRVRP